MVTKLLIYTTLLLATIATAMATNDYENLEQVIIKCPEQESMLEATKTNNQFQLFKKIFDDKDLWSNIRSYIVLRNINKNFTNLTCGDLKQLSKMYFVDIANIYLYNNNITSFDKFLPDLSDGLDALKSSYYPRKVTVKGHTERQEQGVWKQAITFQYTFETINGERIDTSVIKEYINENYRNDLLQKSYDENRRIIEEQNYFEEIKFKSSELVEFGPIILIQPRIEESTSEIFLNEMK